MLTASRRSGSAAAWRGEPLRPGSRTCTSRYRAETAANARVSSNASTNRQLSAAFNQHLQQTKQHARRLEQIFERLEESAREPKCEGMEGLIAEGDKMAKEDAEYEVRDAGLIAAAQRVEHYEIAGYGCARTYAELLGDKTGARLLDTTLKEEGETDKKLTKLAKSAINLDAIYVTRAGKKKRDRSLTQKVENLMSKLAP